MPFLLFLVAGICAIKTGARLLNEQTPPTAHWIVFATSCGFAALGVVLAFFWERNEASEPRAVDAPSSATDCERE